MRKGHPIRMRHAILKGALSGVAAGASVLVARRLQQGGILEPEHFRDDRWDRFIRRTARQMGLRLNPRTTTVAGTITYLAYAGALGALFGAARVRLPLTVSATAMLESALVFAASLPFSGIVQERKERRRRPKRTWRRPQIPIAPVSIFGGSAKATFDSLARRR